MPAVAACLGSTGVCADAVAPGWKHCEGEQSYPKRSCKSAFFLNRCCSHTCYCELLRGSFSPVMELSFTTLLLFLCESRGARMHQRRMPLHFPSMH